MLLRVGLGLRGLSEVAALSSAAVMVGWERAAGSSRCSSSMGLMAGGGALHLRRCPLLLAPPLPPSPPLLPLLPSRSAPWYLNQSAPGLKHQKNWKEEVKDARQWYDRGAKVFQANKWRKGSCEK